MERKTLGTTLIVVGLIGAVLSLMVDTTVDTGFGRVNNIGLIKDQQNYLILSSVAIVAGIAFLLLGGATAQTTSDASRACPQCAEIIKKAALKCRFCGAEVDPIVEEQGAADETAFMTSVASGQLTQADLMNLAEFYGIEKTSGAYAYQGQSYGSLAEAVSAARVARKA